MKPAQLGLEGGLRDGMKLERGVVDGMEMVMGLGLNGFGVMTFWVELGVLAAAGCEKGVCFDRPCQSVFGGRAFGFCQPYGSSLVAG